MLWMSPGLHMIWKSFYKRYSGTLIGDYIGYFLAKGRMDTVEKKALYYGLQALLETGSRR